MYVSPNLSPHLCSAYVSPYPYTDIYLFLSLHVFPYIYLYTRLHTLLYPTLDLSIHLPIYPPTYLLSILVNIFNPILLSTVMYRRFSFHYNRIITHSATTTMISWSAEKIEKMMAEFCEHRNEIPAIHTSPWTGGSPWCLLRCWGGWIHERSDRHLITNSRPPARYVCM
jgi:hypothetical protein